MEAQNFVAPDVVKVVEPRESILFPGNRTSTVININFITIIGKKQGQSYQQKETDPHTDPKGEFLLNVDEKDMRTYPSSFR